MCGRMSLSNDDIDSVADEIGAGIDAGAAAAYRPRFNVAPTDPHPIVRLTDSRRWLGFARWGFGFGAPAGTPIKINARCETAATKFGFREAFARGRCLVPADGFFEWGGEGEERRPYWIHRTDGRLLLMAGLCEGHDGGHRFTILTTAANALLAKLHDRMPVILAPGDVDAWLYQGGPALLRPAPEDVLTLRAVSRRVNSVKNDDPGCLEPDADPPRRQLTLF
jgi:putative SOS response-associated peptidase YedK